MQYRIQTVKLQSCIGKIIARNAEEAGLAVRSMLQEPRLRNELCFDPAEYVSAIFVLDGEDGGRGTVVDVIHYPFPVDPPPPPNLD